jgi:hypothetical protein
MADERALEAVARIERAIDRIEAAAARPAPPPTPIDEAPEYRRLRSAHDRLRDRVAGAIGQLDQVIAQGEPR